MGLHSWDDIVYCDIGRVFEYKQFEKEWEHITHNETELMRSATALRNQHSHGHGQYTHYPQQQRYYHPHPTPYPVSHPHARTQSYHGYAQMHGQHQHHGQQQQQPGVYYNSNGCGPPATVSGSYSQSQSLKSEAAMLEMGLSQAQPPQHSQGNASYKSYNSSSMSQSLSTQSELQ